MHRQAPLQVDQALRFQLFLPDAAAAGPAVKLHSLTQDLAASSASPILGLANFEATVDSLPDDQICLGSEAAGSGDIIHVPEDLAELKSTFDRLFSVPRSSQQGSGVWHRAFQAFLKALVERRSQHVELWLSENMAAFPEDVEALTVQVGATSER